MNCTQHDDRDVQHVTTFTYDAFGNKASQETEKVIWADVPIVLSPPGACEDEVTFEYRFDGLSLADDDCKPSLEEMGFDAGDSNLYRYCVAEVEDVVGLQYNSARHFDPSIGRWLSQDPVGFEAGDSNLFRCCEPAVDEFLEDR